MHMLQVLLGVRPQNIISSMDFCSYIIRGLNSKQAYVKDFLRSNNISFIALLETRVKEINANSISSSLAANWSWVFNYSSHPNGRIWLGWNPNFWNISILFSAAQIITCSVMNIIAQTTFLVSFIYGFNEVNNRRSLWSDLIQFNHQCTDPWLICGDFNSILSLNENSGGSAAWDSGMEEFKSCVDTLGMTDLRGVGNSFTWWNSCLENPILRKLDRA